MTAALRSEMNLLSYYIDVKATGANIHRLKNILNAAVLAAHQGNQSELKAVKRKILSTTRR